MAWIYVDRLGVSLRLLMVNIHLLSKHCNYYALRMMLISCTNISVVCAENMLIFCTKALAVCTENYTDILREFCDCLH
jgi:hypothetical protein